MRKNVPLLMLLSIILLGSCVSNKKFQALEAEKNDLEKSLTEINARVNTLEEDNSKLNMEKDKLNENLSSVKSQLSTTEMEVKKVQSAVDDKQSQLDAMRGEMKSAFSTMEEAVSMSQAEIYRSNERIKVIEDNLYLDLHDQLDFKTGSNRINPEDTETLEELAKMLNENPNLNLVIEGHTDDRPISNDKYSDNWDLSVARSTQIVRKLIDLGVNPEQLIAAGRSEYLPADTTDPESTETRAANRRVEVMLLPNIGKLYRMQKGN